MTPAEFVLAILACCALAVAIIETGRRYERRKRRAHLAARLATIQATRRPDHITTR